MRRERASVGYEYATRALLEDHLEAGDVFLDIGAHWGIMALQAATHRAGDVSVLAFEPAPHNITHLQRWIDDNHCSDLIEIIGAAVSDSGGRGALRPESTMGHSLVRTDEGAIPVVSIDDVMAARPELADRRVIVKIDVEGQEPEVISGMATLLKTGNVALIIWERGVEYDKPEGRPRLDDLLARLDALGFTSWRFESEDLAGPLVPFVENGTTGNIVSFAPGMVPKSAYGAIRPGPVKQPEDPLFDMATRALALFQEGTQSHVQGKTARALTLYGEAAALDSRMHDLYNNLGVMVKDKMPAVRTASYWRAHHLAPNDMGILSNLANALREEGDFKRSQSLHDKARALAPSNIDTIYNAALVYRDTAKIDTALSMFEQVLASQPNHYDCAWDRALVLLQGGDYAKGLPAYEARWNIARAVKRQIQLPRWDGSSLKGKSIFIHDEQGFGDVLQFARFIPSLKEQYGAEKVVFECQPELMRLMTNTPGVDAVIPRNKYMPQCDVYSPLLSLPGIYGTTLETLPNEVPYLFAPEPSPETQVALPQDKRLKLGLVWAGQLIPRDRSCPLDKILPILDDPRFAPISLQIGGRAGDLKALGADTFITDMSPYLRDFAETAAVMEQLDLMITIDTSVAHLAGALGVPTFLLLRTVSDWRWFDHIETSPWYPSMRLFRQSDPYRWDEPVAAVGEALKAFTIAKRKA
jgi:FkbM family methyltransferase